MISNLFLFIMLIFPDGSGEDAMIRSNVGKLESTTELLLPCDEGVLYESYVYFKSVYWLEERDTLLKNADLSYSNDRLTITSDGFKSVASCDSTINKIRNSSLAVRMQKQLNDSIALHIGSDNELMKRQMSHPNSNDASEKCYSEFESEYSEWFEGQINRILTIKDSKIKRFEEIENTASLDKQTVSEFLNDFGSCEVDFNSLELIILKDVDLLLTVLNSWTDREFNRFKWKLNGFKYLNSKELVVQQLKRSTVKSARKRVLTRIFKKVKV